jgi:hypothetical protein
MRFPLPLLYVTQALPTANLIWPCISIAASQTPEPHRDSHDARPLACHHYGCGYVVSAAALATFPLGRDLEG